VAACAAEQWNGRDPSAAQSSLSPQSLITLHTGKKKLKITLHTQRDFKKHNAANPVKGRKAL